MASTWIHRYIGRFAKEHWATYVFSKIRQVRGLFCTGWRVEYIFDKPFSSSNCCSCTCFASLLTIISFFFEHCHELCTFIVSFNVRTVRMTAYFRKDTWPECKTWRCMREGWSKMIFYVHLAWIISRTGSNRTKRRMWTWLHVFWRKVQLCWIDRIPLFIVTDFYNITSFDSIIWTDCANFSVKVLLSSISDEKFACFFIFFVQMWIDTRSLLVNIHA